MAKHISLFQATDNLSKVCVLTPQFQAEMNCEIANIDINYSGSDWGKPSCLRRPMCFAVRRMYEFMHPLEPRETSEQWNHVPRTL